jgi:hypothetical protein
MLEPSKIIQADWLPGKPAREILKFAENTGISVFLAWSDLPRLAKGNQLWNNRE